MHVGRAFPQRLEAERRFIVIDTRQVGTQRLNPLTTQSTDEGHPGTKSNCMALDRIRHQLRGAEPLREIPRVP
jgi:hypothetical protein